MKQNENREDSWDDNMIKILSYYFRERILINKDFIFVRIQKKLDKMKYN